MSEITFRQELLRKSVHLSSLWIVLLLLFEKHIFYSNIILPVLFFSLAGLNLLLEYWFFKGYNLWIVDIYRIIFKRMLRENNGKFRPSGSPPFLAAAGLCSFAFGNYIASYSMSVMILADTAAALIGRKFGRHRFGNGKSLEGSISFLFVSIVVLIIWMPFFYRNGINIVGLLIFGLGGCILAAFLELFNSELGIDDNLSIPVACGFGIFLAKILS